MGRLLQTYNVKYQGSIHVGSEAYKFCPSIKFQIFRVNLVAIHVVLYHLFKRFYHKTLLRTLVNIREWSGENLLH